ncbi:hypothetical protein [Pararhizobium sp.]|uniref:hypothetical protein n=1 Tax=Pararhizobium sp. TaxID=1977563 RepID=UPI00271C1CD3|nr:hypothetical protein [Pararhizobium sp.]MDO9415994.1 hypothetical protein [Pararhizobium sp.]
MADDRKLTAGFTGAVTQDAGGLATQAKDTALLLRQEASAAAAAAQDHPVATGSGLLLAGLAGLALGYVLGSSSQARRSSRSGWL